MPRQDNVQVNLIINGNAATSELNLLQKQSNKLQAQINGLKKGTQEYVDTYKQLNEVNQKLQKHQQQIGLSGLTIAQLTYRKNQLYQEIRKNLIPGTDEYIRKTEELKKVNARLDSLKNEIKGVESAWSKFKNNFALTVDVGDVMNLLKSNISTSINKAAELSDQFADIRKTTGLTAVEVQKLSDKLSKLNTRTSLGDLLDIAKVAGQIGIAKDQIFSFTESVDKAVVALGDEFTGGAVEVSKTLGTLKQLFTETKNLDAGKAINDIGSALNALGSAGTATGPVVAEFAARIGQLPGGIAPTLAQSLGLGAALQELGLSAELASGGLTNVFLKAGENSKAFAKQLGITEAEFKKAFNEDSNATILRLAQSFKGLSDTEIIKKMQELGIGTQESIKVLGQLANNTDLVTAKQKLASEELAKGTSLTNEFNIKNATLAAQIEKAQKTTLSYVYAIGNALAPAFIKLLQIMNGVFSAIGTFTRFIIENRTALIPLTIALIAFNAQLLYTATVSRASAIAMGIANAATTAWRYGVIALNLAMRTNPIGFVIGLIASLVSGVIVAYNSFKDFRLFVDAAWASFKTFISSIAEGIIALATLDFSGAYKSFSTAGEKSAKAFNDSYKAEADKQQKAREEANKKAADDAIKAEEEDRKQALKELDDYNKQKADKEKQASQEQLENYKQQQEKLIEAQKAYAEKKRNAEQALEDLRNSLIKDSYDREIAVLQTANTRKIADIQKNAKGSAELEKLASEQIALIKQEEAAKIIAINQKRYDDQAAQAQKAIDDSLSLFDAEEQARSEQDALAYESKRLRIEEQHALDDESAIARYEELAVAEQERQNAEYELEKQHLEKRLALLTTFGQGQSAEAQKTANDIVRIDNERRAKQLEADKKLAEGKKAIQQSELNTAKAFLDFGLEIAGENAEAKVALGIIDAGLTIAGIYQKMNAEIAGYYAAYSLIPGGSAVAATLSAGARLRAGLGIATVLAKTVRSVKFEDGGQLPFLQNFNTAYKMANGGMLRGPQHANGGMRIEGSNIEVEGGEFVTNRLSSLRNLDTLRKINANPDISYIAEPVRKYETGGQLATESNTSVRTESLPVGDTAMMQMVLVEMRNLINLLNEKSDMVKEVNLSILPLMDAMERIKKQRAENQS
jgi:TP901 family phage tail tape measure protein